MPTVCIETSVRTMLLATVGVADANITHGFRLQDTALPAITYEVTQEEVQSADGVCHDSHHRADHARDA